MAELRKVFYLVALAPLLFLGLVFGTREGPPPPPPPPPLDFGHTVETPTVGTSDSLVFSLWNSVVTDLFGIKGDIVGNADDIVLNTADVATNTTDIVTLNTSITGVSSDISAVNTDISTLESDIVTINADIPNLNMALGDLKFVDGSDSDDAVYTGGKVGIGTLSPDAVLDVAGMGNGPLLGLGEYNTRFTGNSAATPGATGILFDQDAGYSYKVHTPPSNGLPEKMIFSYIVFGDGSVLDDNVLVLEESGRVGMAGVASPSEKLEVNGNVLANAYNNSSDLSLKQHIQTIDAPMSKIQALRGVSFEWKDSGKESLGFVAQEAEKVVPQLVKTNEKTEIKSLGYANVTALLVEGVKGLEQAIAKQKEKNKVLRNEIEALRN